MKKIMKWFVSLIVIVVLSFALFLTYMTITEEVPEDVIQLDVQNNNQMVLKQGETFSTTIFNIGYGGLDKEQDFFMDGGKGSRSSSEKQTLTNLENTLSFLQNTNSDFILIQEIDVKASRSYNTNQVDMFKEHLKGYDSTFAYNYNTPWVPVPLLNPMGYVNSGLLSFSKYKIEKSTRYQLPGRETWPVQLFELDRAIIETKIPVDNGKYLRMVNLHLSAYDKGGKIRAQQVTFLIEYMNGHYKNGDYVVLGGDWNHLLSDVQFEDPNFLEEWPEWLVQLPEDFTEGGFQWAVDSTVYTVRDNVKPYVEGENFVTIIDGFLVSPNIEIVDVTGFDLGFENSDHNPVTTILKLK
ncbi:endonuclease/exonuclease/phosphatase family protein [Chengkuizengella axinellae]|uniref:Endonuclease/exonuclease/phosphatase family protein n=1 Tax=Chengkuizengella axinellae TaxID=3064388 RepID=A0ABT9ITX2_9BACL|nr:endonuclease/exonuclease/phosphatase family protein [Chengkuizengella sp. 2205SS18-9]MDP5272780.1 endonuclease/exonuclease/phosphatase family protein [Chengkuizengella sp. 2205SS18-9]